MKVKKLFVMGLLIICVSSLTQAGAANQDQPAGLDTRVQDHHNVVASVEASSVSEDVLEILEDEGALITDESIISIVRVIDENAVTENPTAVCITTAEGDQVQKDVFLMLVKDENGEMIPSNALSELVLLRQGPDEDHNIDFPPADENDSIVIHGTATRAMYKHGIFDYYKPYRCKFSYDKLRATVASYISVNYVSAGGLYTYPGFEYLQEYSTSIEVAKNYPTPGMVYSKDQYFFEDRVMMDNGINSGSLVFTFTVDGVTKSYSVTLSSVTE